MGVNEDVVGGSSDEEVITNINVDYFKYFNYSDAWELATYDDMDELQSDIWETYGHHVQFSIPDMRKIVAHARKLVGYASLSRGGYE